MSTISLTNTLNIFEKALNLGRVELAGYSVQFTMLLASLEAAFGGLYLALGWKNYADIAKRMLMVGFTLWMVKNYQEFIKVTLDGFIWVGKTAVEGNYSLAGLRNPDAIVGLAFDMFRSGFEKLANLSIFSMDLILAFASLVGLFSMFIVALQVFITYLEFMLVTTAGVMLIPFSVFRPFAFIAERLFGAIVSYGIKLMILTLLIGVMDSVTQGKTLPPDPGWKDAFDMAIFAMAMAFLSWHAPSAIQGLLSGTPQLTAGHAVASAGAAKNTATHTIANTARIATVGAAGGRWAYGKLTGGASPTSSPGGGAGGANKGGEGASNGAARSARPSAYQERMKQESANAEREA